jgi:hypothetical protein
MLGSHEHEDYGFLKCDIVQIGTYESFGGSWLLRFLCWYLCTKVECVTFQKTVILVSYGDTGLVE